MGKGWWLTRKSAEVSADAPIVLVQISNLGWEIFIEGWDAFTRDHPSMQIFHPKFEICTKTIGASALTSADFLVSRQPFPVAAILHNIKSKYNKMV